jgi:hypothetical protein
VIAPYDSSAWSELLAVQHGLVSRQQCRDHGITDDQIRRMLGRRLWTVVHRGVYLTEPCALDHEARTIAALLAITRPCCASHETALWLEGSRNGPPPELVHVAVLEGTRVARFDRVRVHHLPDLGDHRVNWSARPPRTRRETTLLDLTHQCATEDQQIAVMAKAVRDGLTTPARLRMALAQRPRMRNRALVVDIISDVAAGAQSPLEVRDLRNDRAHGIGGGQRQVQQRRAGRNDWLDVVFSGNGLVRDVVKELDGRLGHDTYDDRHRDMKRDNAAEARGQSHLRYGWTDIVTTPCDVAWEEHQVLSANGWRTPFRYCGDGCAARLIA